MLFPPASVRFNRPVAVQFVDDLFVVKTATVCKMLPGHAILRLAARKCALLGVEPPTGDIHALCT